MKKYIYVALALASVSFSSVSLQAFSLGEQIVRDGAKTLEEAAGLNNKEMKERREKGTLLSKKAAFLVSLIGEAADTYALTSIKGQEQQVASGLSQLGAIAEHHAMALGAHFTCDPKSLYNTLWRAPERLKRLKLSAELGQVVGNLSEAEFKALKSKQTLLYTLLAVDAVARAGFVFAKILYSTA